VSRLSIQCGILNISHSHTPPRIVTEIALPFYSYTLQSSLGRSKNWNCGYPPGNGNVPSPPQNANVKITQNDALSCRTWRSHSVFKWRCLLWYVKPCILFKLNRRFERTRRLCRLCLLIKYGFLLGVFLDHEDGEVLLLNVDWFSAQFMAKHPRRQNTYLHLRLFSSFHGVVLNSTDFSLMFRVFSEVSANLFRI
jgi:hypothetical protein